MVVRQLLSAIGIATLTLISIPAGAAASPDTPPYRMIARYPIGGTDVGYDYLRVDSPTRRVFVAHASRVEVLDADTGKKLGEIAGLQGAHGIEIIESLNKGYITAGLDRAVTVFD